KYIEVTDANSPFGEGNQHLRLHYQGAAGTLWTTASNQFSSGSQVVTVQFDFFRPSTTSWGAPNTGGDPRLRLGVSDPVGSNNNRVSNQLFIHGNGSIAGVQNAYSFDTVHTVKWVYNYSTSQATYEDYPELTIDSNHFDVWLDGTRIVAGFNDGTSTPLAIGRELTSLGIMAGTAGVDVEMMFDNITVYAGAIPEPSTYAFGAGILALGAAWMWRRRRAA
ncbi:MAG TPA: hypothetical protein VK041_06555, partial [Opitutales bacterium]|nr:hypothetical protein [Opitutales bacterium]